MNKGLYFMGRLLLVVIFLFSALGKIMDFAGTAGYMKAKGMTAATEVFLVGAIVLLLFGGLSVLTRIKLKWGVAALLIFLISATAIFHNNLAERMEMIQFMKNLSMMGGLICLAAIDDYID